MDMEGWEFVGYYDPIPESVEEAPKFSLATLDYDDPRLRLTRFSLIQNMKRSYLKRFPDSNIPYIPDLEYRRRRREKTIATLSKEKRIELEKRFRELDEQNGPSGFEYRYVLPDKSVKVEEIESKEIEEGKDKEKSDDSVKSQLNSNNSDNDEDDHHHSSKKAKLDESLLQGDPL